MAKKRNNWRKIDRNFPKIAKKLGIEFRKTVRIVKKMAKMVKKAKIKEKIDVGRQK